MPVARFDLSPLAAALNNGTTILVPNQRIREALLAGHADTMQSDAWRTPSVYAIDIWIKTLWQTLASQGIAPYCQKGLLSSTQEALTWQRIIDGMREELPLLNSGEAARQAQTAYQLLRMWLGCDAAPDSLPGFGATVEQRLFRNWYSSFESFCAEAGQITLADATQVLIANIESLAGALPQQLSLVNFYQPPPLYRRLFETLEQVCRCSDISTRRSNPRGGALHSFTDFRQEVTACSAWAQQLMADEPTAHIGIVFEGDDGQRRAVERLFADRLAPISLLAPDAARLFNSVREPRLLTSSGLVSTALELLGLGDGEFDSETFCHLLQSPHIGGYISEREPRLRLETQLRKRHGGRIGLSRALKLMSDTESAHHCPLLARNLLLYRTAIRALPDTLMTHGWSRHFASALECLGWPGDLQDLSEPERRCLQIWRELLTEFAAAAHSLGPQTRATALSRLRNLCRQRNLTRRFANRRQLSLYTLEESVGLEFTHTWFLNFNDQSQPGPAAPSAFLPYSLQRESGHPGSHGDARLERARQSFEIVCASTSAEVHASFHESDGDEQFRPSRLALSLKPGPFDTPIVAPLNALAWGRRSTVDMAVLDDDQRVPLRPSDTITGGQQILSNQSACPFRAFTRHRLDAAPLEEFGSGIDSRLRGSAVHRALERLFQDIPDSATLLSLDGAALTQYTETAGEVAVDYLAYQRADLMTPRFRELEKARVATLLTRLLETERLRGSFEVVAREERCHWDIEPLTIELSIDRIDRLADGSLAVIDYKTGKRPHAVRRLADSRPEDLQLPIYYCASTALHTEPVSAVVITHVNVENIGYSALVQNPGFHPNVQPSSQLRGVETDWESLTGAWQDQVRRLAIEFGDGSARVDPTNGGYTCQYCGLQALCRIGELQRNLRIVSDDEEAVDARA